MNYTDMYSTAKAGLGMFSDGYGSYTKGQEYEEQSKMYRRNALETIEKNKNSFMFQEHAKDRAEFGAALYTEEYLHGGKKRLDAIEKNLEAINNQTLLQANIAYEQSLAVDETLGNMMSRNALDAMKAEARLIAGAGGTGTSGGSTEAATHDADSIALFDDAVLIGRAAGQKLNIARRMSMERVSAKNQKSYVASKVSEVMGAQGAGAAYSKGYSAAYDALSPATKSGYISSEKAVSTREISWLEKLNNYKGIIQESGLDDAIIDLLGNSSGASDQILDLF